MLNPIFSAASHSLINQSRLVLKTKYRNTHYVFYINCIYLAPKNVHYKQYTQLKVNSSYAVKKLLKY